ncbi:MAG: hypothetical protein JRI23_31835, partial [Deltaproteobacteria bacterium]|nr:hypothetical protein [Deltaproteobacteria bacterium]MBW2536815.1 hypothetical protein [Deltaproteobacteria bacterium]
CAAGDADSAFGYDGYGCADCRATDRLCKNDLCVNPRRLPSGLVDDRRIYATTDDDAERMRRDLVRFVWGSAGYPTGLAAAVTTDVSSPSTGFTGFDRIDELQISMDLGFQSFAYLFHPPPGSANDRLVVYHQGHSGSLGPNGGFVTVNTLLAEGYAVLGVMMPGLGPNQGPVTSHDEIMALASDSLGYDPMKFFLEPVAVALNQIEQDYAYEDLSMTGISGGGWTTTLVAALEPRLRVTVPVAGTLPLYLRVGADRGDAEQFYEPLYEIAGYPDLYVLGSSGAERVHAQVLARYDSCCFAGLGYRQYESAVSAQVGSLAAGSFRVFLDESHLSHQISPHALAAVILPELAGGFVQFADDIEPFYGRYSTIGTWTSFSGDGFGNDVQAAAAGNGDFRARWELPVTPGTYDVAATWQPAANRATDATYVVQGTHTVSVDQELAPASFVEQGTAWEELAAGVTVTGTTLSVELSNLANEYVIADAIRIERVGD